MSQRSVTLEQSTAPGRRAPTKRHIRTRTFDFWMSLGGSVLGSLAFVAVVYEHVLDGSGTLGFLITWFATFLAMYAALTGMSNPRPIVVERLVTATLWTVAGVVAFALGSTIVYTFAKGWNAYTHLGFFIHSMAGVSPTAPLSQGGIVHAIIGTVVEVGLAVALAVPLGIATAVYMAEVGGRLSRPVRTVVEAMTALPEILAGLFVYVVLIVDVGLPKSGLAASIAMAVTMVPIIARASEVALRVVPSGLREASLALGASQWRTVRQVVLPNAKAGLATASILGVARGVGETAVVLITSGASTFVELDPVKNPMNSLPLFIYTSYSSHEPTAITRAFGAASVLLTLVLALFVATRFLSRDRSGQR